MKNDLGDVRENPGKPYSGSTSPRRGSGYTECACRDCFDTTVSDDMRNPELCSECAEAGCEGGEDGGECQREDAHDVEENPRLNPEPDSARAEEVFEMWHKKNPRNVSSIRPGCDGDDEMVCVGRAHNIVYRSGKWEKGRKTNDYIHHFDSKPKVWMLRHLVEDGMQASGSKSADDLLRRAHNADGQVAVADLANPLSFGLDDGTDEGTEVAIHNGSRVYGAIDQKTVIICDPHWKLIVIQGGKMTFDERGIVK